MTNHLPIRPTKREKVYDVLDGERDYQDKTYPGGTTLTSFAVLLQFYSDEMLFAPSDLIALKRLREIAAIAVHAMEIHGAQPRENHVPASAGITGVANIVAKSDSVKPVPKQGKSS